MELLNLIKGKVPVDQSLIFFIKLSFYFPPSTRKLNILRALLTTSYNFPLSSLLYERRASHIFYGVESPMGSECLKCNEWIGGAFSQKKLVTSAPELVDSIDRRRPICLSEKLESIYTFIAEF